MTHADQRLGDTHVDARVEHRLAGTVGHRHAHGQVIASVRFDQRLVGRGDAVQRALGLLQVFDRHALRDPAHRRREAGVRHHAGGEFGQVAQRDRVHRADVVVHPPAVTDAHLAAARFERDEARRNGGEIRRLQAHRAREQPVAGRPTRDAVVHRQQWRRHAGLRKEDGGTSPPS
jgi:hypothetical protein